MGPKKWTKKKTLLAKDIHLAEKQRQIEQNLLRSKR